MGNAGYPDLHAHIAELDRQGLLIRVQRPINKDTEMHPLVRWQFRGGIPEAERKAFLFENVIDSKGRKYDIPVAVGILASNRQIYSRRHRLRGGENPAEMGSRRGPSDTAGAGRKSAVPGDRAAGRRAQRRQGGRRAADPDLDARLRQCALCVLLDVHHQGSRYRAAKHRQLPRHGEKPYADGHEPGDRAQPGHPRAFSQIQGARRENAGGADARRAAGDHLHLGAQAAEASRRARGGRRPGRRADQRLQGQDRRPDRAGGSRDRGRRLSRHRMAGARGQLRRIARLYEPEGVQRLLRRHRDHPAQERGTGLDHQPGDAVANRA